MPQNTQDAELTTLAKTKGFYIWSSGGNCCCFRKDKGEFFVTLSNEADIPETDLNDWEFGYYQDRQDSEPRQVKETRLNCNLESALAYAAQELEGSNTIPTA